MKMKQSGKYIKRLRKLSGMTQIELSKKTGITQGALSKYENGMKLPALHLVKIMSAMGIKLYLIKE